MFRAVSRFFSEWRAAMRGSRHVGKARRLYDAGQLDETANVLKMVLSTVRPPEDASLLAVQFSVRLTARTLLAMAAAKVGDPALAVESIGEARALWSQVKSSMRPGGTAAWLAEWDIWAQRYWDWSGGTQSGSTPGSAS